MRVYQPGCEVSDLCNSLCLRICGPSHFGVYGPRRGEAEFAYSAQDVNSLNCRGGCVHGVRIPSSSSCISFCLKIPGLFLGFMS